jgi:UPF0755 protein
LIRKNSSISAISDSLSKKKSVFNSLTFSLCAHILSVKYTFEPGRYALKPWSNNLRLLNNIIKGRQEPVRVSFNNIRTKEQLCGRLANQLMADSLELITLLNNEDTLQKYGFNKDNVVSMFIPNTYEVYWTISSNKFLQKMHQAYLDFWTYDRKEKAAKAQLSPIDVSIVASIVEEESNMASEKPTIAGLYLNRYYKKMKLQADPTIKFALQDFSIKRVLFQHIEEAKSSPYSTYENIGLPPGPIRIPSIESIDAVLNFQKHNFFFMCAKGSGGRGHDFSVSFEEHLKNAQRYRGEMNKLGIK